MRKLTDSVSCFILMKFFYGSCTWRLIIGVSKDMCVMAREDEVENEQEVAQPTEAEAAGDEEYVEDVIEEDVDDGKARFIVCLCAFLTYF